eukprot:CAMPEP_0184054366 /NCGR_PEP_ID=MMETSP0956-20121227/6542_1 /TAXON_ID=627963 /ORGANISM="Aplanochytrium sp, Strain PBS07" /LENGTH=117 /DNA_ID=CAMNT_0026347993 /DNA_START=293 /DNA_END=643 /DNA_ORIENTATION=-
MEDINWTYVNSYEEALEALNNGAQNISTYDYKNYERLVEYNGNVYSFSNFAKALASNRNPVCLSLYGNDIGAEGAKEIADALKVNTSLTSLDLNNNNTGPEGAKEVADALKINTSLA